MDWKETGVGAESYSRVLIKDREAGAWWADVGESTQRGLDVGV